MSEEILGCLYTNSQEPIKKGDLVLVDDLHGRVDEVCMPGSELADSFNCEDTGGLLILFEDGVLSLLPFGHFHRISKLRSTTTNDTR